MAQAPLTSFWDKPALIIFSETEPSSNSASTQFDLGTNYLYISDDNRDALDINFERIEYKQRMINGNMRSYYVNTKRTFSTKWKDFPSRKRTPNVSAYSRFNANNMKITSDGFGAGMDILDWYNNHTGSFWMLLVYDGVPLSASSTTYANSGWAEKVQVFFDNFDYSISKRGMLNDLWDISMSLVEV